MQMKHSDLKKPCQALSDTHRVEGTEFELGDVSEFLFSPFLFFLKRM